MASLGKLCMNSFKLLKVHHPTSLPIGERSYKRWVSPALRELYRRKVKQGPEPIYKRSGYLDWNYNGEIFAFGKRLNEEFNSDILKTAFVNRSYILQEEVKQLEVGIENPEISLLDNRQLADRGEQFISKCINEFTYKNLPKFPDEGKKCIRDFLMSKETLANISSHLGTKDIILSGEYPPNEDTLAQTFKAIIGALIESSGETKAADFVKDFVLTKLNGQDVNDLWHIEQPMKLLTDILLKENRGPPEPRLILASAKNTILALYRVGIYSDKKLVAIGSGESVSIAVEMAAREALKEFFETSDNMKPFDFSEPIFTETDLKNEKLSLSS